MKPLLFKEWFLCEKMNNKSNSYIQCYCCGYFTIKERGNYEICSVCFWEDDGGNKGRTKTYSGVNYMTLEVGRMNFIKIGACASKFIQYVQKDPETKFKYEKLAD